MPPALHGTPHPPLVVSGQSAAERASNAQRLARELADLNDDGLRRVCLASLTAPHGAQRGAVVASDTAGFVRGLAVLAEGRAARNVVTGTAAAARRPVFVFPGQGVVWPGMATGLFAASAAFRGHLQRHGQALVPALGWNPVAALAAGESLTRLASIQPVQFLLASALVDLWRDFGLSESAVVGHSMGEVAACRAAGLLDPHAAAGLTALWCTAFTRIEGQGAMASVAASAEQVGARLARWAGRLVLAAVNSPRNVTVSGDGAAVDELLAELKQAGVWAWKVPGIDVAGHSPHADVLRELVLEQAPQAASGAPRCDFYSTVTGARLPPGDLNAGYWFRTLREKVVFEEAVRALIADGHRLFIEVSSHPVLTPAIQDILQSAGVAGAVVPTLDRRRPDGESFVQALAHAFVNGAPIAWDRVQAQFFDAAAASPVADLAAAPPGEHPARPALQGVAEGLADRLRHRSPAAQHDALLDLVDREVVALLGHAPSAPDETFQSQGFTSLNVVELAQALSAATGVELATTLVYDHPTPAAVARHLRQRLGLLPAADEAVAPAATPTDTGDEPIAIIGMACRYPGGVDSPDALWQLVQEGRDAIGPYPTDRGWAVDRLYDPEPGKRGHISAPAGGFLYDAAEFDAGFFGIAPREATAMEPQQRLLLEVSWEAIERAGIDPGALRGTRTGVYAGLIGMEYGSALKDASDEVAGYAFMGTAGCVASGRVAYALGLEGPALTVDTACSSSLVAIHTACAALRHHDCDYALAGGATVMSTPGVLVEFSRQRVLAPDGRCKPFAAAADGIGLSEGVGMVLLARLSQARARGHTVLALITGTAVNQDGASNGLSAPNGSAQQQVIRQALSNARLQAPDVDAVEAHGTGTRLGDPIEAHALLATYGQRPAQAPLWLGSIKSNIGHTQAAAGVASLIKMVMALRHQRLPRSLHIDAPSNEVAWSTGQIRLLTEAQPWPATEGHTRRAAVSSFGVSGTNAHVILEQPPLAAPSPTPSPTPKPSPAPIDSVWVLSAKTDGALRAQAARLHQHVQARPELNLADLAHALATTRSRGPASAALWGRTREQLLDALQAVAEGRDPAPGVRATLPPGGAGKLVFVFPGQGSQWDGMGMALYDAPPAWAAYREALDRADHALRVHTGWSVVDVLRGAPGAPSLERVDVVQPVLFAVMVALARLWQSFGLVPAAVVGHSQGEIAAAHIAGALSLDDAARVVVLRSRAVLALAGTGAMATVALNAAQAQALIDRGGHGGCLSVAVSNSAHATVVSGEPAAVEALLQRCEAEGVRAKRIAVDYASHSPHLDPLRPALMAQLAGVQAQAAQIPFYSCVEGHATGAPLDGTTLDAAYWCDNLRQPVRFADTVEALCQAGRVSFLECSPHGVLLPPLEDTAGHRATVVGSLQRGKPAGECLASTLAQLWVAGHGFDARALHPTAAALELPTTAFERRRFWLAPQAVSDVAQAGQRAAAHGLLGAVVDLPNDAGWLLTGRIGLATHPWLADHGAAGVVLVPGTAYLDMALHAAGLAGCTHVAELVVHAPMVLSAHGVLDLQLKVGAAEEDGQRALTLHARSHTADGSEPAAWTLNATARLGRTAPERGPDAAAAVTAWPPAGAARVDLAGLRSRLALAGYDYGAAFAGLHALWQDGDALVAEAELPEGLDSARHVLHPALLDAALQPIALPPDVNGSAREGGAGGPGELRLPFSFSGVSLVGSAGRRLRTRLEFTQPDTVRVRATDDTGRPVLTIEALHLRASPPGHLQRLVRSGGQPPLLRMAWRPLPTTPPPTPDVDTAAWALLDTDPAVSAALQAVPRHASLAAVFQALKTAPPEVIVWPLPTVPPGAGDADPQAVRALCEQVLHTLQTWLAGDPAARTLLAVVTRRAVAVRPHEVPSPAHAPLWALLHTAQNEHPGRIVLLDTVQPLDSPAPLAAALAGGHAQVAWRDDQLLLPHLDHVAGAGLLAPPADTALWRLDVTQAGTLDHLVLRPAPEAGAALREGQVRIGVRAAGVNFYDMACALGLIPPQHDFGAEAAGTVLEVGPGVDRFAVGDRVMALTEGAFGPVVVTDHHGVARMPLAWSYAQAATVPVAFVTAFHGLVDLGRLQPGQRVLIHAAAGGVGQAAVQLARHLGAEVFATAHPSKWDTLRRLGLDDAHIASSRTLAFAEAFGPARCGAGMDVVLNSLTGAFIDASMDLLKPGGHFIELGKTDIRDAPSLAQARPGLVYRYFDRRQSATPQRTAEILALLLPLFQDGVLSPLPFTAYGVAEAAQALRLMQHARHSGKLVLTLPRPLDPAGTVLITGGTGGLGGLLARHLVLHHGVRHLLLASRSGLDAPEAARLQADLQDLGACVTVRACDAGDRTALQRVLAAIAPAHPLTGVFHTAGVLSDATIDQLSPAHFQRVFAPKADAAWHLHELTRSMDLAAFVLYSSTAGTLGNPGQANYVAANAYLDALAHGRRRSGLPATSIGWGWWQVLTGLSRHFSEADNARIARSGLAPIGAEEGHALLDAAMALPLPALLAAPLNLPLLRHNAEQGSVHPLLAHLARGGATPRARAGAGPAPDLRQALAALAPAARTRQLLTLITQHSGQILGLGASTQVLPDHSFKASGLDSLMALELRNRLTRATGLRLPATLTYDFPTPSILAAHLVEQLFPQATAQPEPADDERLLRQTIDSIPIARLRELGLLDTLLQLAQGTPPMPRAPQAPATAVQAIQSASLDELLALASAARDDGP